MIANKTQPLAMATPAEALAILGQVDAVLVVLNAHVARVVLSGELNAAQREHVKSAFAIVDWLRERFHVECERQVALSTTQKTMERN